ncbi:MAG: hypothetical protein E7A62_00510 [Actinomycetaceae bacterium]|nr:hypothetical protein [Actinomycetaceae bacterium]MDU0969459.1 hypothetical protein [Actinomycetaceae bacterium]
MRFDVILNETDRYVLPPEQATTLGGARADGTLIEVLPGVLAPPRLLDTRSGRAAIARTHTFVGMCVIGASAAWMWAGGPPPYHLERGTWRRDRTGAAKHLPVLGPSYEHCTLAGIEVATPRQALVDLAAGQADDEALGDAAKALAPLGVTARDALALSASQRGVRGGPKARARLRRLVPDRPLG